MLRSMGIAAAYAMIDHKRSKRIFQHRSYRIVNCLRIVDKRTPFHLHLQTCLRTFSLNFGSRLNKSLTSVIASSDSLQRVAFMLMQCDNKFHSTISANSCLKRFFLLKCGSFKLLLHTRDELSSV